jgi:hypothetical protein
MQGAEWICSVLLWKTFSVASSLFQEVIMMLETFTKDFKSLIERMELMRSYEHDTKVGQR